jgi:hypothetical protein
VTALEAPEVRRAERRWVMIGGALAAILLVVQVAGGLVREAVTDEPSYLELVQTCLTERDTPFEQVGGDLVAQSAKRGALRTTVDGNAVTVTLGGSEKDAARVRAAYASVTTEDVVRTRLEQRRKVVLLWDSPPTAAQRDFIYLCTRDAQE